VGNIMDSSLLSRFNSSLAKTCHVLGPIGGIYDELYFQYCQALSKRASRSLESLRRFPSADVIVSEASTWIENTGSEPFFLWLHFMDPHSPYYPKEEALRWMADDSDALRARYANSYWNREDIGARRLQGRHEEVVALYDAGIRWVDSQIGRLVDKLRRLKLWDNCVFAVTADHGEEFLEHGGRYHSPAKLTEELIHVPLLLHGSKASGLKIHSEPFSLIDLAPTLLDSLDIPAPATFRGTSLWAQDREVDSASPPAIVESIATCKNPFESERRTGPRILAIRESVFKLVIDFASSENNLFNLRNDPGELHPLRADAEKPVRRRLLEGARAHIAESIRCREPGQSLDAQLRRLRLEWGGPLSSLSP
jgi:arylsulfatase A-like enzyme